MNEKALTGLITAGAAKCAQSLGQITGKPWEVAGVALSVDEGAPFEPMLAGIDKDHYGSHFSVPGATFLVMFSGKSGYLVTNAFTRGHQGIDEMDMREARAVAEAANIFLNPLLGHLAQAWKRRLIISAPEMQVASQRDLLTEALAIFKDQDRLAASFYVTLASPALAADCTVLIFLDASLADLA